MTNTKHTTAFYVETILLILAFVAVALTLSRALAAAQRTRDEASALGSAVLIARNGAEAVAAAGGDARILADILAAGQAESQSDDTLCVRYDKALQPDPDGIYRMTITWDGDEGLVAYHITVQDAAGELYALDTAVYKGRG